MELGTITALVMLLLGLSHVFDNILKEPQVRAVREKINLWFDQLGRVQNESVLKRSAAYFVELFDAMYGEKHFSWKCFWRSCVFSIVGLLITFAICIFLNFDAVFPGGLKWSHGVSIFLLNLFIDYFSLIQTRVFLDFTSKVPLWSISLLLAGDICFSFMFYYFPFVLLGAYMDNEPLFMLFSLTGLVGFANMMVSSIFSWTPFLYSTYFTSITFYLFVIVTLLIRILLLVKLPTRAILGWFRTVNNPIKVVVGVLGGIVMILEALKLLVE